jgi:putative addiction module component (TIGR02574 family)
MRPLHELDLSALSPVQKMDLADALYDSAQQELEAVAVPLTAEQLKEIDRRCIAVDAGELATEEWHVVHDRLQREL